MIIHNYLYKNVVLNHEMLNNWFSVFISSKLQDNITYINNDDHDECLKYSRDFWSENLKNEFQKTIAKTITNLNTKFMTNSFITDIECKKRKTTAEIVNFERNKNYFNLKTNKNRKQ